MHEVRSQWSGEEDRELGWDDMFERNRQRSQVENKAGGLDEVPESRGLEADVNLGGSRGRTSRKAGAVGWNDGVRQATTLVCRVPCGSRERDGDASALPGKS